MSPNTDLFASPESPGIGGGGGVQLYDSEHTMKCK